jgi:signal peptidase II
MMTDRSALLARWPAAATFIALAVILDQVSKFLVEAHLPLHEMMPVLPFWALYRTWNEGVAFSFLSDMDGWVIVGMRLVIIAVVLWWWRGANSKAGLLHLGFAMIVAGAIGNIIDRLLYGHVVDFVLLHTDTWSFAVFNLADAFITVGAVFVGVWEIFLQPKAAGSGN